MKHELEDLLRAGARREIREAPTGLVERVRSRLDDEPLPHAEAPRRFPLRLVAGLAAAGLLAYSLWPRPSPPPVPQLAAPSSTPTAEALAVVEYTQKGLEFAARIDRPLADEWHLMVQNSVQLCDALLGELPNLPR